MADQVDPSLASLNTAATEAIQAAPPSSVKKAPVPVAPLPKLDAGQALRSRRRRLPPFFVTLFSNAPLLLLLLLLPAAEFLEGYQPAADKMSTAQPNVDETRLRMVMLIGINITLAVSLYLINGVSGQFSLGHAGFMAVGAYLAGYSTLTYSDNWSRTPGPLLYFLSLGIVMAIVAAAITVLYALIHSTRSVWRGLPGLLLLVVVVWLVVDFSVAGKGAKDWSMGAWVGNKWFGLHIPVLFARALVWIQELFNSIMTTGGKPLTLLIALIGGGLCSAAVGLVVGIPTLRLRGDYLAIATLGFAFIITNLITLSEPLGKATGLSVIPYANVAEADSRAHYIFPWIYGTAIVTIFVVWRLTHSPAGRAILATREDEVAASAIGLDTTRFKILAFVVGAFFAGIAGGLYAHLDPARLDPKDFDFTRSVELVVMVTVGGLTNLWGVIIAAIVLTFLPLFLRDPQTWIQFLLRPIRGDTALQLPAWLTDVFKAVAANQMVVYAALLILIMLARGRNYLAWLPRKSRAQDRA